MSFNIFGQNVKSLPQQVSDNTTRIDKVCEFLGLPKIIRGEWEVDENYLVNDIVVHAINDYKHMFMCTKANIGHEPVIDCSMYWLLIAITK